MNDGELLQKILQLPGVSVGLLQKAIYRLRKNSGKCVHFSCPNHAVPGKARCSVHQTKNAQYAKRYQLSLKEDT